MLQSVLGFLMLLTATPESGQVPQNPDFVAEKVQERGVKVPPDKIKRLRERVRASIKRQAKEHDVNPDIALAIAKCESNFNPYARNNHSTATGVYQWLRGSWQYVGGRGSRTNYKENIRQFMIWYPKHKDWWVCHNIVTNK